MNPFTMPLYQLSGIASIGGMLVLTTIYYVRNRTVREISSMTYFKDSIDKLKKHEGGTYLLGSPIQTKVRLPSTLPLCGTLDVAPFSFQRFDFTDRVNNVFVGEKQQFAVPVRGL
jgi:hypothetical protein